MKPSVLSRIANQFSNAEKVAKAIEAQKAKRSDSTQPYVAPRTPTEEIVANIWAEVLHVEKIGINDNFFALGGHSLRGTQVVARIRQSLGIELPLRSVFELPTVAGLSEHIDQPRTSASLQNMPSLVAGSRPANIPLSFAQQRLWFLDQLEPGNAAYNIPQMFRLRGALNIDALQKSLDEVVRRHEVLRTSFVTIENEPVQTIGPAISEPVAITDLSHLDRAKAEDEVQRLATEDSLHPFDLTAGRLLRATLLRLQADEHVLLLTLHHIAGDRWSMGLLSEELAALYSAYSQSKPSSIAPLALQYADYAIWQRDWLSGNVLEEKIAFWKKHLDGAPALLELPTDRPRPAMQSFRGTILTRLISHELNEKLLTLSREHGVTQFMTILAAFQTLLTRYSRQEDVVVGSPVANRSHSEVEPLIGFFVNTLALRTDLSGNPTFKDLLARVREVCLNAYAHQDVPFEGLVEHLQPERSLSYNPIFQVLFALQNAPLHALELTGITLERMNIATSTSMFDLSCFIVERPEGVALRAEYNTDLFDESTITRFLGHYEMILRSIVENPEQAIADIPILPAEERAQILDTFNATAEDFDKRILLHQFFETQVGRTPGAIAIIDGERQISYAELNQRANQLAHFLLGKKVTPDSLVAICANRSIELLVGILGILKTGAAYVPLDPAYPKERIQNIVEDAHASILLTQSSLVDGLPSGMECVCIDSQWSEIAAHPAENPAAKTGPEHLAYVLFTSGSTGRPKGVALTHGSASTFVQWAHRVFSKEELAGVLLATSVCFDLSIFEIFVPLSIGGKIILAENALYLPTTPARNQVTLINTVPSAIAELVRMDGIPASVKTINLAGEALPNALVDKLYALPTVEKVYNLYGPTEDTTYSTFTLVPRGVQVTIGRPLSNTQAYILDRGNVVPIGVPGELFLAGDGLARGYYGRPDLTADRFLTNPFRLGKRMYRTGDLCRWLPDGQIQYLGRIDHQVKVRGFRIELGELEATFMKHESVQDCVAVVREDEPGYKQLVAYVVLKPGMAASQEALQAFVQQTLPAYMVPSAVIILDTLPLTPNRKVDRKALPAPDKTQLNAGDSYVAPRNSTEETLAEIWCEVLRLKQVGVLDDFFSLGGHSLLATQVVSRIRQAFRIELPLRVLFEAKTVASLGQRVEAQRAQEAGLVIPELRRLPRGPHIPLSFAQHRLWFLNQIEPDSAFYNIPSTLRLTGSVNITALRETLREIVQRHEALRTTFHKIDNVPVQFISPDALIDLPILDLTGLPEAEREREALRLAREESQRPFDLLHGPLLRATLLKLADHEHMLLLNVHHIACDGWSIGIFVREIGAIYRALVENHASSLPELPVQYSDYAVWQRNWLQGDILESQLNYWRTKLAGMPPVLDLPTDRPRPKVESFRGAAHSFTLPAGMMDRLKKFSHREGVTLFMTLLAGFQTLLSRYCRQEDIAVGSPIANRNQTELEGLIGFFVNTLVMRTDLSGNPTFRELLARAKDTALGSYAHQDLPFEKLVEELQPERTSSHNPLFQVLFALQNAPSAPMQLSGLTITTLLVHNETAKFDLALFMWETGAQIEFNTDLFDLATIQRMAECLQTLLEAAITTPEKRIAELPLLPQAERQRVLVEWNATNTAYPQVCLHKLIEDQVERTPDAPALAFGDQTLTYRQLNARANQLAHYLRKQGIGRETLVAVCMERSLKMVIALLGIIKAGGAYLPLDPEYPIDRLATMLEDSQSRLILSLQAQQSVLDTLPPHSVPVVALDSEWSKIAGEAESNPEHVNGLEDAVYVIYTSGSTGLPKGVVNIHSGIVNRLVWAQRTIPLNADDRFLQKTPYSFDVSVTEFFWPLLAGSCLVVAVPGGHRDPAYLVKTIREQKITTIHFVPSMLQVFLETHEVDQCSTLKQVLCSGEALSYELQEQFFATFGEKLHNLYGPTEAAVDVSYWRCNRACGLNFVPIGYPVANTQLYVLDPNLQPVPIGVAGELFIGGVQLAREYLRKPALTTERFIPNSLPGQPSPRLYKTGDLARFRADGAIEYLGRLDNQVKVRGFRIELGEIEAVISKHGGVRQTVVIAREDDPGNKQLVAYVVPNQQYQGEKQNDSATEWRAEQVSQWQVTFESTYSQTPATLEDPTFNITGWNSSYTGQQIPAEQMKEWVDRTVERIHALTPKRVLEIGCGTGLLLFRLAPECEQYCGTDFSQTALDYIEAQFARMNRRPPQLTLSQRTAEHLDDLANGSFDAVVINSVAQYFPSIDYLVRVLEGAMQAVQPGGSIFLGDIRSLPLLETFHLAVQLQQASASLPVTALVSRVKKRVAQEGELVVDPAFFRALQQRYPKISAVEIHVKRARYHNEMSQFRYDVVLHVGGKAPAKTDCAWIDWSQQKLNAAALKQILTQTAPEVIGVTNIPNAYVWGAVQCQKAIAKIDAPAKAGDLLQLTEQCTAEAAEPEELWAIGEEAGYLVHVTYAGSGADGYCNAVLKQRTSMCDVPRVPGESITAEVKPWSHYASNPLQIKAARTLVPELRQLLSAQLPEYMVPSAFVMLDSVPLTSSGKVDRRALPAPDYAGQLDENYQAPRSPIQEVLANIWAEVLRLDRIGLNDDFFDLGGHSLLATQVISRIRQSLEVELPLRALFESPTLSSLANTIENIRREQEGLLLPPLRPVPRRGDLPLSFAQQRLWFLDQMEPDNPFYNISSGLRFTGTLHVEALQQALNEIVRRHEVLRTIYSMANDQPVQIITTAHDVELPLTDLSGLPEDEREAEMKRLLREDSHKPINLARGPVVRVSLLRLAEEDHVLLLTIHHIASDGWSTGIFLRELGALYEAFSQEKPNPLPDLPIQYADYAMWQRQWLAGEALEKQLTYWRSQLEGAPPLLELRTDHPRPMSQSFRGATHSAPLPGTLIDSLRSFSRQQGVTLFMTLLAAYEILLWRYSNQDDFVLGTDVANRNWLETEGMIGFFVNVLPLRSNLTGNPTFNELLGRVREVALGAYGHQDMPLDKLVEELQPERTLSHNPLVQVLFVLQNIPTTNFELPGLTLSRFGVIETAKFDLAMFLYDAGEDMRILMLYNPDLFEASTIEHMTAQYEVLLRNIVSGQDARLSTFIDLLEEQDKQKRALQEKQFESASISKLKSIRRKPAAQSTN